MTTDPITCRCTSLLGVLHAAQAHIRARDVLDAVQLLQLRDNDPRFAAVHDTLADLAAAIAKATGEAQ